MSSGLGSRGGCPRLLSDPLPIPLGWLTLSASPPLKPGAPILVTSAMSPLPTLSPQAVEKLVQGAESGCHSEKEKQIVLNCSRLLTRVLPYIFEDPDWRGFFWSTVPGAGRAGVCGPGCGAGWKGCGEAEGTRSGPVTFLQISCGVWEVQGKGNGGCG